MEAAGDGFGVRKRTGRCTGAALWLVRKGGSVGGSIFAEGGSPVPCRRGWSPSNPPPNLRATSSGARLSRLPIRAERAAIFHFSRQTWQRDLARVENREFAGVLDRGAGLKTARREHASCEHASCEREGRVIGLAPHRCRPARRQGRPALSGPRDADAVVDFAVPANGRSAFERAANAKLARYAFLHLAAAAIGACWATNSLCKHPQLRVFPIRRGLPGTTFTRPQSQRQSQAGLL